MTVCSQRCSRFCFLLLCALAAHAALPLLLIMHKKNEEVGLPRTEGDHASQPKVGSVTVFGRHLAVRLIRPSCQEAKAYAVVVDLASSTTRRHSGWEVMVTSPRSVQSNSANGNAWVSEFKGGGDLPRSMAF